MSIRIGIAGVSGYGGGELLRLCAGHPVFEVVYAAGTRREPQRLCAYARELAEAFHVFYGQCRVLTDDSALTAARLALVDAVRRALRNTLDLAGVTPTERM